jgi:hypothetical protein
MNVRNRREFLADVGRGMLVAGLGSGLAADLGLAPARAADGPDRLTFGPLEPLVGLMQDTPADKLQPLLVERIRGGTELRQLVGAAALANARTFGGEDYTGYHTLMALAPAYHMASELPAERQPLPVLKVLYRNSTRIQQKGGRSAEVLHPVTPTTLPEGRPGGEVLREAVRKRDLAGAERTFAALAHGSPAEAFDQLLVAVEDGLDVHRIVLPYRAWMLLNIVGAEHAHTLLRQSVRYCIQAESPSYISHFAGARALLPKLFDQYRLPGRPLGKRPADDSWVDHLSQTIFQGTPDQAAEAAAAALAEGFDPSAIGEAVSLATNQLVLRDAGRPANQASPGKPPGSVHGDSIGVHACDSANAWRGMARVSGPRNTCACLILAAYQAALDRVNRGGDFLHWQPRPWAEQRSAVKATEPAALLREAEEVIRANDQARACAVVARAGELGHPARPVFDLLLRYAVSEEGALHAEKYYRTVTEEFAATRPAFRWRQLVALARVTASEYGQPAAGYAEACRLLKV